MRAGNPTLIDGVAYHSDEAFQKLLLRISDAAARGIESHSLVALFCRETREFFQCSGVYLWRPVSSEEFAGWAAAGPMEESFPGTNLKTSESAIVAQAIQQRHALYVNGVDDTDHFLTEKFHAQAVLVAPLVTPTEVIGVAAFVQYSTPDFFNNDLTMKAAILAGQLASLLEAIQLTQAACTGQRQAERLTELVRELNRVSDLPTVLDRLANQLRALLDTGLVTVLLQQVGSFELSAIATEAPQQAASARARYDRSAFRLSADLAARALTAGEPVTVAIDPAAYGLGDLAPAGRLIVAPFRTSSTQGAVLVYPRLENPFTGEEKCLVASAAGLGAMAIAKVEIQQTSQEHARELHQLLEISSELNSIGNQDQFMEALVVRAADFLGFGRCFIAPLEEGSFHVRWGCEQGRAQRVDVPFPEGVASRALLNHEVFWTDDPGKVRGANLEQIAKYQVRQILAVPLLGPDNQILGMFGVLDRRDRTGISPEDIRRAKALAAHVAVALQVTRNLHLSELHRKRANALMGLALQLSKLLRLPEFAESFASQAAELMAAKGWALVLYQDAKPETVVLRSSSGEALQEPSMLQGFSRAVGQLVQQRSESIIALETTADFPASLAKIVEWQGCVLVRLTGATGELVGVLCLADLGRPLGGEGSQLLQAISSHASVALENARLFSRMEQSNRHWMEIFDAITDFIVVHDENHNVLRVNRSLAEFIGVSPKELVGLSMRALLALATDVPPHSCPFCRSGDTTDEYVHPVLERTYLVSTSRIHGAGNENLQTIHVLKDITDRREAERRYRELFDNIQEGLFFSTPEGRFVEVNDAMVRMLGYQSRDELLHTDVASQMHFSAEARQHLAELMQRHGMLRNHEETLRRKDGSPVHVLINAFAVPDAQGKVLQYRGLMLDVTGLKSFQAELQRERDFSSKIVNHTQSLIVVADTAGLISYVNRRWFDAGYEQKQLLGKPLIEMVPASRQQVLSDALAATIAGHQVDNLDLQVMRGDGRFGQFSVNLSPMRDEQGVVTSIVVVMTDITDSAMLQSKLLHAEKMAAVGKLVSGVAHEVNNPLTAILGFADLLLENAELPEPARKDLRVILHEAQRTKQIVQNLLSFARQMPPQRNPVQVNTILRRTVQLRAYDFNSHGVNVVEVFDENLPRVMGDSHQLQQVFLNILNNAYDAVRVAGRPARIEISTASAGNVVEISFRDNGHGISHPEWIFDPFYTTKEVGKGTGLGLSICYGIVHEHGGEILCHNNAGSEGATFVVRLPAISETATVSAAAGVIP